MVEETSVDANTLSYELTWLEDYSKYRIKILAFTVADGPKSQEVELYTDMKVLPRKSLQPSYLRFSENDKDAKAIYKFSWNLHVC